MEKVVVYAKGEHKPIKTVRLIDQINPASKEILSVPEEAKSETKENVS